MAYPEETIWGGDDASMEPLKLVTLGKGDTERTNNLELWLRYWLGDTLTSLEYMGWFEE